MSSETHAANSPGLSGILESALSEFSVPALQAGILRHGNTPILASAGKSAGSSAGSPAGSPADDSGAGIDDHHAFRIGSTTKLFVAVLICRMAEENLLSLDDSLSVWFPDFPGADSIRVSDLLAQTSGISESLFTNPFILMMSVLDPGTIWQPAQVMKTLMPAMKPAPVEKRHFLYSNNNYVLLGLIAERAGGQPLHELLETRLFDPLGLTETCLLPWSRQTQVAAGYDEFIPFGPHLIPAAQSSWDSLTFAAGGMASSAHDLLIFLDALFHDGILTSASLSRMQLWSDAHDNGRDNAMVAYGLGLARYESGGSLLLGHPGGGFGGECYPFYDPETDTSFVVSCNLSRKDNPAGKAVLARLQEFAALSR